MTENRETRGLPKCRAHDRPPACARRRGQAAAPARSTLPADGNRNRRAASFFTVTRRVQDILGVLWTRKFGLSLTRFDRFSAKALSWEEQRISGWIAPRSGWITPRRAWNSP